MHSFRDRTGRSGRTASLAAMAALFPEFAGVPGAQLAEGLLRAPRRGRVAAPCLSLRVRAGGESMAASGIVGASAVLANRGWEDRELLAQAAAARQALVAARVGGSWWQGDAEGPLPHGDLVVVADLPADKAPVAAMLERALSEVPPERIVVLTPRGRGQISGPPRGVVVRERPVDPWRLIGRARRVYSGGGELGFLALLAGVPVTAFGAAFYTGWGVTEDVPAVARHAFARTEDEIFAGACFLATRYRDPFRDRSASLEDVLGICAEWRRLDDANRRVAVCVGMSFWKRRRIAEFLRSSAASPVFRRTVAGALAAARRGGVEPRAIAGWASRLPVGLAAAAARTGVPLIRVEDGFIRSVGLGSDFLPPASLVCDWRGMYFDPRQQSDLEILLRETEFGPALIARAQRLAVQLVARGITKYNLAGSDAEVVFPPDRTRILVPGQVEDDLSIRLGGGEIRSNLALLQAARAANPDALILYKPHPDVVAGHRTGAVPERTARQFADIIVRDASVAALLAIVDELHTMTSLAGFEALLRGRRVVVYGRPFYAGWGLTVDRSPFDRGRRLTLDELVAGVLILYPRYLDPLTRLPCGPEIIIERLDHPELWRPGPLVLARRLQGTTMRRLAEIRAMLPIVGTAPARGLSGPPRP